MYVGGLELDTLIAHLPDCSFIHGLQDFGWILTIKNIYMLLLNIKLGLCIPKDSLLINANEVLILFITLICHEIIALI